MKFKDQAAEIKEALRAISHAVGKDDAKKVKEIAGLKDIILADVKRIDESNKAFHAQFAEATCTYKITWGCAVTTERGAAPMQAPHAHPQVSAAEAMARTSGNRIPVAWGGGHCWFAGHCWICLEWSCH